MKRIFVIAVVLLVVAAGIANAAGQFAAGVVFSDTNHNGVRDPGEKGIEGVRVSNGRASVKTDRSGNYRISVDDDTVIFVVKPRNWRTAIDSNNVSRFYYVHKPNGSPKLKYAGVDPTGPLPASVDFPLYPHPEPNRFRVALLGDSQPYTPEAIGYFAHDIVEELLGTDAAFGVLLGDNVGDDLSLYGMLIPVVGKIGIPCYYVKGNHDSNYDGAPNPKLIDETFERNFGPSYYSFDYGPVHFIALNNQHFNTPSQYEGRLGPEQMAFLKDDLASISKDQLVVLMMHIPIVEMKDRKEIFALLESHPNTFSVGAHWHTQSHLFLGKNEDWNGPKPHHHLVNVTTCGSWWSGSPDELGIPHTTMSDGAPNGYSIATFTGNEYSIRFKAARRPDDYQMNIYAPDVVEAAKAGATEVLVNVFAGSERSKVEMRLGDKGAWAAMERIAIEDPAYVRTKTIEDGLKPRPGASLPGAGKSPHIWKANLPKDAASGTYLIQVRTTDMFGQSYAASRVVVIR